MEHFSTLLFYGISFLMHFHRFCDLLWPKQNVAEPYVERFQPIRVNGSHDVDFTHGNKIMHYFHCVGDASPARVSVKPGTPRNTPEHPRNTPGTAQNNPEQPRNTLKHPIILRNTLETARNTPGTPKIVVSGQTAHELTKPKTSEDSQFFIRLLQITLTFPSISRMLRNIFEAFKNSEKTIN